MSFLFLVLMAVLVFGGLIVTHHYFKMSGIYCFALGCGVNANIFSIGNYPIVIGNFVFGVDSVLYTLFVFGVLLAFIKYREKMAFSTVYLTMAAIGLGAVITFVAEWATLGLTPDVTWSLLSFTTSILATYVACLLMIKLFKALKKKKCNLYINVLACMILATIVNSIIYFGVISIFNGGLESNFGWVLFSSYIGKVMSIGFALISLYLINLWDCKTKKRL